MQATTDFINLSPCYSLGYCQGDGLCLHGRIDFDEIQGDTKKIFFNRMDRLKDYPDVLTPEHLRVLLHIGKNKVYELLQNGEIKSIRIGQQYRIPKIWLDSFLLNLNLI